MALARHGTDSGMKQHQQPAAILDEVNISEAKKMGLIDSSDYEDAEDGEYEEVDSDN